MTDTEILIEKYNGGNVTEEDLSFGRIMPFGKYKGKYIYHLLVKHWRYMDWIVNNTKFKLTETEKWWKNKIDITIAIVRADKILNGLPLPSSNILMPNIENPHLIIE